MRQHKGLAGIFLFRRYPCVGSRGILAYFFEKVFMRRLKGLTGIFLLEGIHASAQGAY